MTAIRIPVSFSLAGLVTVTMFWFLGALISGVPSVDPIPTIGGIEFTILIPEEESPTIPRIKPTFPKPDPVPDHPGIVIDPSKELPPDLGPSPFDGPDPFGLGPRGPLGGHGEPGLPPPGGTDRNAMPQVRIEPDYPQLAKARGLEGWITFSFTVTREGRVKDVAIVDADPPKVWDAATLRAVSNWRYQPRMKDGVPVEQRGVTATYRFKLDR